MVIAWIEDMIRALCLLLSTSLFFACDGRALHVSQVFYDNPDERYACALPEVFCDAPPPACPWGSVAEASDYAHGGDANRCWTGRCLPCGQDCVIDDDCRLITQQSGGFSWSCTVVAAVPTATCDDSGLDCTDVEWTTCVCETFARCEGGACVTAHPCEPDCDGLPRGCPR